MKFDKIDVGNSKELNLDLQEAERVVTVEECDLHMIEAYTKMNSFTASSIPEENKNIPQPTAEQFTKPLNSMESLPTCEDFIDPYKNDIDSKSQEPDKKTDLTATKQRTNQRVQSFESRESQKHKDDIPGELLGKGSFISLGVQPLNENNKKVTPSASQEELRKQPKYNARYESARVYDFIESPIYKRNDHSNIATSGGQSSSLKKNVLPGKMEKSKTLEPFQYVNVD